mgnify:CR=1 FL=1
MKEYVENMKEYVKNLKEYVKNLKEYVKNLKEYEEICQYIGFGTPISLWVLGLGKILPSITACWRSTELSEVRGVTLLSP